MTGPFSRPRRNGSLPAKSERNTITGFFSELKRRRVLHIGGAYIAGAWLGAEILSFLFEQFQAPDWSYRLLAIVFVVGFPVSMVLAWVVQVKEDGSWAIDPSHGDVRNLAIAIGLGLLLTAALSWLILPGRAPSPAYEPLPHSLAVIPFTGSTGTPNEMVLSNTLYLSVMKGLEQSTGLTLVRLGPGEPPENPTEFGRSLSVQALATGRVSRSPDSDSIEVKLTDVEKGELLWSQRFDLEPTQIIETGNAIANGLLQGMALPSLSPAKYTGTQQAPAYKAFLSGEEYATAWDTDSLKLAIGEYQEAIALDKNFARAYVGLAGAIHELLASEDLPEAERQALEKRAGAAVDLAQKLDGDSADVISLLGLETRNRQLRIQAFERALEIDPDHYLSYYRYAKQMKDDGNLEDAERLINRAITLRPMNSRFRRELAEILRLQGREEEARAETRKSESFTPDGD